MVRIPLLMKFPASAKVEPRRFSALVETVDIVPTIFDYIGCQSDTELYSHGLSMLGDEAHPYLLLATWARAAVTIIKTTAHDHTWISNLRPPTEPRP